MIRGTSLTPGSTIFSGDTIEVGANGNAWIAVNGGAQVQVSEYSQVQLTKREETVQLIIERGRVSFRTTQNSRVEALLADATICSADGGAATGVISLRNPDSAIIGAEKGSLVIRTSNDARSVTLHEGEGVEVPLASKKTEKRDKDAGAVPAGTPTAGRTLVLAAILGGTATAIGILLAHSEQRQSDRDKANAVSPFKF